MIAALAILAQASALDALDAAERRLAECPVFSMEIRREAPGREPSTARFLCASDGRFRLEWHDPSFGDRVAVCDGRRILNSPRSDPFLLHHAGRTRKGSLLADLLRVGLPPSNRLFSWDRASEYTIREGEGGRYILDGLDEPWEVEIEFDRETSLPLRRHVVSEREEWTETIEWDLSPAVAADAFNVPWDFGLPPPVDRHPWVPAVERGSFELTDASLLRAGAELIERWDIPVVVSPKVARRRASISVDSATGLEAAAGIARAWGVAMRAGSGAIEFVEGEPPEALAVGGAGPFCLRVTTVEREGWRDLATGEGQARLWVAMTVDRLPAPGDPLFLWRAARDDQGREIRFLESTQVGWRDTARELLGSWAVVLEPPPRDARWITLEGTISVIVPEGFESISWDPSDLGRDVEAAGGRMSMRLQSWGTRDEGPSGIHWALWVWLRPGEGIALGPRSLRVPGARVEWPPGERESSGAWRFAVFEGGSGAGVPRGFELCWGARRVDLPFRIEEVPLP